MENISTEMDLEKERRRRQKEYDRGYSVCMRDEKISCRDVSPFFWDGYYEALKKLQRNDYR